MNNLQKALNDLTNVERLRPKESGFFDLPKIQTCRDPQHEPPKHLHIPQGKGYRHVCPKCGQITDLVPPQISF